MTQEAKPGVPTLNTHDGSLVGPIAPVDDGGTDRVFLTRKTLGWSLELYPIILIQVKASAAFDVLGLDGETWCPYPGASTSASAGDIKVIRGRWKAIRITTDDVVYVKGDLGAWAYQGSL